MEMFNITQARNYITNLDMTSTENADQIREDTLMVLNHIEATAGADVEVYIDYTQGWVPEMSYHVDGYQVSVTMNPFERKATVVNQNRGGWIAPNLDFSMEGTVEEFIEMIERMRVALQ